MEPKEISAALVSDIASGKRLLIDVRSEKEFLAEHIPGAVNIPLPTLREIQGKGLLNLSECLVICQGGTRGKMACEVLADSTPTTNIAGGMNAWKSAGLPTQTSSGQKTPNIERQVRGIAGFLVLAGSVIAAAYNPSFIYLPMFIGGGLLFAALSNTCAMGAVLSQMPWNKPTK